MADQTEQKQERVGHEPQANGGPPVSSFAKSLFLGEIHEQLVFPYPKPDPDEQERIRGINNALRGFADAALHIAQHVSDPHVRLVPGAGHFAPVLAPEPIANELIRFFASVRQEPTRQSA